MLYDNIIRSKTNKSKQVAVLLDPDKCDEKQLIKIIKLCNENKVDFIFIGGSLLYTTQLKEVVGVVKKKTSIPVVLFPGNSNQITNLADGILLLSLISGRNADCLIGQHVVSAPLLKQSELEILPTGYILIDCGKPTSASYMSNTTPIPYTKDEIAVCTAMAGEMLGLKLIFMDGGSGAEQPISTSMVQKVKSSVNIPIIVGGGIKNGAQAQAIFEAGADVIVVGTAIEKDAGVLAEICNTIKK